MQKREARSLLKRIEKVRTWQLIAVFILLVKEKSFGGRNLSKVSKVNAKGAECGLSVLSSKEAVRVKDVGLLLNDTIQSPAVEDAPGKKQVLTPSIYSTYPLTAGDVGGVYPHSICILLFVAALLIEAKNKSSNR